MPLKAQVIVVGNEKGGSGKTTIAMHLVVSLLRMGFKVGAIDLDLRQQSFARYIANRRAWIDNSGIALTLPMTRDIAFSLLDSRSGAIAEEQGKFVAIIEELSQENDFLVIDCPGSDVPLARYAHTFADTLITPINDSLLDLDLLGRLNPNTWELEQSGVYADLVWDLRKDRIIRHRASLDWIVTRNRLSHLTDRNKVRINNSLDKMARVLGFRTAQGFSERVVYRHLFLWGLTLLDLRENGMEIEMTKSHNAALTEIRAFMENLWLPMVNDRLDML